MIQTKTTIKKLQVALDKERKEGKTIGFVPTMGALHDGHLNLISHAHAENDIVVASIFVNPIQFNNKEDLEKYPRDVEGDVKKLETHHTDYVFAPSVDEMYPDEVRKQYDFGAIDKVMEGKFRPGHFNGVAVVVHRLFNIVNPDNAYFGEKDFQQLAIIKKLIEIENLSVNVKGIPTVREPDGLAMSSRNQRLTADERKKAPLLYNTLKKASENQEKETVEEVKRYVTGTLNKNGFSVEYFDIVDSNTLQPVSKWNDSGNLRGCIAAYLGNVRLIDNIAF